MKLFLTSNASKVLDKIVTRLPKTPQDLKVVFIPTAGDPYAETPWITDDRNKLIELGFRVTELDIKSRTRSELEVALDGADIIFVAGGNTFYLLEQAIASGFDKIVQEQVRAGKTYIGSSAGSVIAGPDIEAMAIFDDPSVAQLKNTQGFGLVNFVVLPHFGKPKYGSYHDKVIKEFGEKYKIIPLEDKQFIIADENSYTII